MIFNAIQNFFCNDFNDTNTRNNEHVRLESNPPQGFEDKKRFVACMQT